MRRDRLNRWLAPIGVSASLVVGLSMLGATGAEAASGTVVHEPNFGFSLTLPAKWKQVPLNGSDVTALLNAAAHNSPTLANALNSEVKAAGSKGIKVFAVGPAGSSTVPNMNIIVASSAGAPAGSAFTSAAVAEAKIELTQVGATHTKVSAVRDQLGTAAQATYQLGLKGSPTQFGNQLYVLHGSHIEIVTVTTSSPSESQSVARSIVSSWRWS